MRSRWQEWVITLWIVALAVAGAYALWGDDIAALFDGARPSPAATTTATSAPTSAPF